MLSTIGLYYNKNGSAVPRLIVYWYMERLSVKWGCGRDARKGHPSLSRECEEYMPISGKVRENHLPGTWLAATMKVTIYALIIFLIFFGRARPFAS